MRPTVLLADDNVHVVEYVSGYLQHHEFEVIAKVYDGQAAVDECRRLQPKYVVMDISMPRLNGLEATEQIVRFLPSVLILILTVEKDVGEMLAALRAGARGYVLKPRLATDLVQGLRTLASGDTFVPELDSQMLKKYVTSGLPSLSTVLSQRELHFLALLRQSATRDDILTNATLTSRLERIRAKLGLRNLEDLIDLASYVP